MNANFSSDGPWSRVFLERRTVAAPRLLILADPKMIPALAGGLRDGGRFDVTAVSLAEPGVAQAAADRAEALAVFYGSPGAPLSAALQALAPKLRERGGRVVAVLQREQAAQRDDCFRAGASDVLFMPLPKEQFVGRLAASVGLTFAQDGGAPAPVAVAARSAVSRIERATVSAAGVESPSALSLKPGETVRLSWGSFQSWGLVVRSGPSAQIRFAGLAPDEEAKIQQWVKSGAQLAGAAPAPAAAAAPIVPAAPPAVGAHRRSHRADSRTAARIRGPQADPAADPPCAAPTDHDARRGQRARGEGWRRRGAASRCSGSSAAAPGGEWRGWSRGAVRGRGRGAGGACTAEEAGSSGPSLARPDRCGSLQGSRAPAAHRRDGGSRRLGARGRLGAQGDR